MSQNSRHFGLEEIALCLKMVDRAVEIACVFCSGLGSGRFQLLILVLVFIEYLYRIMQTVTNIFYCLWSGYKKGLGVPSSHPEPRPGFLTFFSCDFRVP